MSGTYPETAFLRRASSRKQRRNTGDALVFLNLLFNLTNFLCKSLQGILVVGVLRLEIWQCISEYSPDMMSSKYLVVFEELSLGLFQMPSRLERSEDSL